MAVNQEPRQMTSKDYYDRGMSLYDIGKLEDALAAFSNAVDLSPENVEAWFEKGFVHTKLSQPAEAIASFDRVIAREPLDAEAWQKKGEALFALGDARAALSCFDRILCDIFPKESEIILKSEAANDRQHEKVIKTEKPEEKLCIAVLRCKADALSTTDRHHEAALLFERLACRNPRDAELSFRRAEELEKAGMPADALAVYKSMSAGSALGLSGHEMRIKTASQRLEEILNPRTNIFQKLVTTVKGLFGAEE